ncbi:MAG TPA: hypothetical protein VIJ28_00490 [Chloroflexota bacterium]
MQDRWAIMSDAGDWSRDHQGKVQTFFSEADAQAHLLAALERDPAGGWTLEPFTVDDALEEAARSPFASEGGL